MLHGDPNPWRDIGHAKWLDPYAGLEDTQGSEFKEAVAEELAAGARRPQETAKVGVGIAGAAQAAPVWAWMVLGGGVLWLVLGRKKS